MTGGEALINQWHDRIIKGQANSTLTAKAGSPTYLTHEAPAAEGDGTRFWTAVRGLIDVNTQVSDFWGRHFHCSQSTGKDKKFVKGIISISHVLNGSARGENNRLGLALLTEWG
jgi:hypothetical protein